jgi:hypothetical protein
MLANESRVGYQSNGWISKQWLDIKAEVLTSKPQFAHQTKFSFLLPADSDKKNLPLDQA